MNDGGDVFDRWIERAEFFAIDIEMFVVEEVEHVLFYELLQEVDGEDLAGEGVQFSGDGNFQLIVMAMAVWIVAAAEQVAVLLV